MGLVVVAAGDGVMMVTLASVPVNPSIVLVMLVAAVVVERLVYGVEG